MLCKLTGKIENILREKRFYAIILRSETMTDSRKNRAYGGAV